eukprot:COSAG05_NODE_14886_length_384_cov_0.898246_1_plen_79_part_10
MPRLTSEGYIPLDQGTPAPAVPPSSFSGLSPQKIEETGALATAAADTARRQLKEQALVAKQDEEELARIQREIQARQQQ